MTKRMLIDATHAEETRVVVLDGNRLEDFDVETSAKQQLKGNIYLAKVVRVEPSLQAAFVEYGGGRHGFLAFGEIHPDYYQIPVADRQRLLEMQEAEARAEEEAEDAAAAAEEAAINGADEALLPEPEPPVLAGAAEDELEPFDAEPAEAAAAETDTPVITPLEPPPVEDPVSTAAADPAAADEGGAAEPQSLPAPGDAPAEAAFEEPALPLEDPIPPPGEPASLAAAVSQDFLVAREDAVAEEEEGFPAPAMADAEGPPDAEPGETDGGEPGATPPSVHAIADAPEPGANEVEILPPAPPPEMLDGAEAQAEDDEPDTAGAPGRREPRNPARYLRSYKIQEVIRRRQILLVQVVKEERGTKGAALTTFISLAGRFSVLMPNSPRGGGISRKITSAADRRRLKEVTAELQIPRGMGLIVRTAGAARPKAEIKRDCEYLLETWDSIRETTMQSIAPALIHEEASLIKRSIRDNYSRDVEEVVVDGQAGWKAARDFMRMLMPAHARKVVPWSEPQPLFARYGVEAQLDAMLEPVVQLRSGGYLVINQTEALVAIDVNSGRSTRERGIEETALKTNLEAADEVARQLRLRDLAGLVVVDFIDMESRRNNAAVEKRIKDALRDDRARIQLGSISHFGLLELSRQRLRPSLAETSFTTCPHCGGTGHVRTTETAALAVLRAVEEEGAKRRSAAIMVHVAGAVALYILNNKRVRLAEIEARYGMSVSFAADESLLPPKVNIEKLRALQPGELPMAPAPLAAPIAIPEEDDLVEEEADTEDEEEADASAPATAATASEDGDANRRKRRRRRRGGRREDGAPEGADAATDLAAAEQPEVDAEPFTTVAAPIEGEDAVVGPAEAGAEPGAEDAAAEQPAAAPEPLADAASGDEDGRGRRRGRRGGRRRRREPGEGDAPAAAEGEEQPASFDAPAPTPAYSYTGPTPADPFGGQSFDIFDMMDEPDHRPAPPAAALAEAAGPDVLEPMPAIAETVPEVVAVDTVVVETAAEPSPAAVTPEASPLAATDDAPAIPPEPPAPSEPVAPVPEELPFANGHAAPPPEGPVEAPVADAPAPEPEVAAEPPPSPVPPPVLVGTVPVSEKKRGWWRR